VRIIGIVSLFVCAPVLGPMAWIMGHKLRKEAQAMGRVEPGANRVGRIFGIVASFISGVALLILGAAVLVAVVPSTRSSKAIPSPTELPARPTSVPVVRSTALAPTAATRVGNGFVYGTGDCAAADGSSPKTQVFSQAPKLCIDLTKTYTATIETTKGTYKVLLDTKGAPGTVNNFVTLARFHFFDSISCHRIVKGFMAQCGDPTGRGSGGPGYSFPDELPPASASYKPGTVAMANSGPNTNGSQFFTMFRSGLPPAYSIFGQVTEGMDTTIKALDAVGNPGDGAPTEPVSITKVTITES
jgi:cyclophilin family peptidyl-prolyl cis-trans isomerase